MNKLYCNNLRWLILSLVVIILDQMTKYFVLYYLQPYHIYSVLPFFNLTLLFNNGAAFSFLNFSGYWQHWFFSVLAFVVCLVVVYWLLVLPSKRYWMLASLALIVGGALGNVVDRLHLGYVVDFLDFHVGAWHWPAFNLADLAITVGVAILLLSLAMTRD
jgi:signal peptidase II